MTGPHPTSPHVSVSLARTLTGAERLGLEEALLGSLQADRFWFARGELQFQEVGDLEQALPLIRDIIDEIWNADGKNITDRFLTVYGTYGMRCPVCDDDSALDVVAHIAVRLQRDGPSVDDARDQAVSWDDASPCSCACGWSGVVADAK